MKPLLMQWQRVDTVLDKLRNWPQSVFLFIMRFWLASIFFKSGLVKIQSWSVTLDLFRYEYNVPLLTPEVAAYLATSAELILPLLLIAGILCRPAALALLIVNIVASISYPDISSAGIKDHYLWGLAFLWIIVHGAGKLSIDYWISPKNARHS